MSQNGHHNVTAPSVGLLLREAGPLAVTLARGGADRRAARGRDGQGRVVMVIPGFLADDWLTRRLRRTLSAAGYRTTGWGLGHNWGVRADLFNRLDARLDAAGADKIALVGWSLGGLYAREVAKRSPDRVERVITLGSPFSGDLRANNAWRLYERVNGHPVDRPPVEVDLPVKPPVPTIALWSAKDGIVPPGAARGRTGEADRTVEVACRHMDFVSAHAAMVAVLDALEAEI